MWSPESPPQSCSSQWCFLLSAPQIASWFINPIHHVFQRYLWTRVAIRSCRVRTSFDNASFTHTDGGVAMYTTAGQCSLRSRYALLHLRGDLSCALKINRQEKRVTTTMQRCEGSRFNGPFASSWRTINDGLAPLFLHHFTIFNQSMRYTEVKNKQGF